LPPVQTPENPFATTPKEWAVISEQQGLRKTERDQIIKTTKIDNFGQIDEFLENGRKIVLVKTLAGGHDYLGVQEGLVDIIGKTFEIL